MKFETDDEEDQLIENWQSKQYEKDPTQFVTGERWEYRFVPTGLGTLISVRDGCTDDMLLVRGTKDW